MFQEKKTISDNVINCNKLYYNSLNYGQKQLHFSVKIQSSIQANKQTGGFKLKNYKVTSD